MEHTSTRRARILWLLRRTFQAVEAEKGNRLRPIGLRAAHYSLMINIAESPGQSNATLARLLGVTSQNVASLAARLESDGLVERRAHSRHEHVRELYLTAEGEKVIATADKLVAGLESDLTDVLGEEDSAHLRRILDRLWDNLPSTKASGR